MFAPSLSSSLRAEQIQWDNQPCTFAIIDVANAIPIWKLSFPPAFSIYPLCLTYPVRNRTTEARTQRLLNYASGRVKTESETNLDEIDFSQGNKTNCRTQKNTELPFSWPAG